MASSWGLELARLAALVLFTGTLGVVAGWPLQGLLAGLLGYVGWTLLQLARLERWLRLGKKAYPPPATGAWAEVYRHVQRLHQRSRKRKRKVANFLKRFRESAAALPDGAVILTGTGEIVWLNAAAARLLGLRLPEDLGHRIGNLVRHPAFLEFLERPAGGGPVEFPSPESEAVTVSVSLIRYGKDERLLLARDVSDAARLEQLRRDFVANVSHELRTPLTVIAGYLEALTDAADEAPAQWRHSLESMSAQASRMGRLVEDLLLLARLESAHEAAAGQEPVAAPVLIATVEEDARVRSAGRYSIRAEIDPTLSVAGESEQLRSVFGNLVQNALQYTPDGGAITLRWYRDEAGAHFQVRDTGIGIAPHHIARLTERFFRVDAGRSRARGGTGLGLAIVKHVLSRHGATLRVESEPGRGSTFTCDFPLTRVLAGPAGPPSAKVVPLRG